MNNWGLTLALRDPKPRPHAHTNHSSVNRGRGKKSMRGASGFAKVELKLSKNAVRCGVWLTYFLLKTVIQNIRMLFC